MTRGNDLINPTDPYFDKNGNRTSHPSNEGAILKEYGLTKREYFAAIAMQGLLANHLGAMSENGRVHSPGSVERIAVMHADALIEELNKI